jgi:hypothetical protein
MDRASRQRLGWAVYSNCHRTGFLRPFEREARFSCAPNVPSTDALGPAFSRSSMPVYANSARSAATCPLQHRLR